MDLLKTLKAVGIVLTVFSLLYFAIIGARDTIHGDTLQGKMEKRIAARDSLVNIKLNAVAVTLDTIAARDARMLDLQKRIPVIEQAIELSLRSAQDLTPAERSELRQEIINELAR